MQGITNHNPSPHLLCWVLSPQPPPIEAQILQDHQLLSTGRQEYEKCFSIHQKYISDYIEEYFSNF
jgi:hypothetical protein